MKKNYRLIALFMILVALFMFGCKEKNKLKEKRISYSTSGASKAKVPAGFVYYRNARYNISIIYPAEWERLLNRPNLLVMFRSAAVAGDPFRENVNIVVRKVGSSSLETISKASLAGIKRYIQDFALVKDRKRVINGVDAIQRVFTGSARGNKLKFLQLYLLYNEQFIVLTYTATASGYKQYWPQVKKMIESLKVK